MTHFRIVLLAGLLLAPAIATAQVAPRPAKPAPVQLTTQPRRATLSPEGRAVTQRIYGTPDPRMAELTASLAALKADRVQLITSLPVDLDRLEALLRKEETLQAEFRTRTNDRLMALLRELPEIDRAAMLQNMANPARPTSSIPPR